MIFQEFLGVPSTGGQLLHDAWVRGQARCAYTEKLCQAIEQVVQIADPVILYANRYQEILQDPSENAMKYLAQFIDASREGCL